MSNPTPNLGPDPTPGPTPDLGRPAGARHPVSTGHLVLGVAFLGLTVVWALVAAGVVEGSDIRFLLPVPWILAGVAGLTALIATDRRTLADRAEARVDGGC